MKLFQMCRCIPSLFAPLSSLFRTSAILLLLNGCAAIGVRIDPSHALRPRQISTRIATVQHHSTEVENIRIATQHHTSRDEQLSRLLSSAKAAWPEAIRGKPEALTIYNLATAEIVALMQRSPSSPYPVTIDKTRIFVYFDAEGKNVLPIDLASRVLLAENVQVRGLHQRYTQPGLGVPYVFVFDKNSPFLANQPGVPRAGMALPATAVLTFKGNDAAIRFYNTFKKDTLRLGHKEVSLAADFSAPLAVLTSLSVNRAIDIRSFLFSSQRIGNAGLFQYNLYDPTRIPVVFVHGLLSRPEAWIQAVNTLSADPEIRKHYQFWLLLYPTGLPVWESATILRQGLDHFHEQLEKDGYHPNLHRIVLVGHSMGGVISSLTIRQSGEKFWSQFSNVPFHQLSLSPKAREAVEKNLFFSPREDIGRVIFVATPHRGSTLASNPFAGLFAQLVRLPNILGRSDRLAIAAAVHSDFRSLITTPVHSIRFLKANSPLILAIRSLPLSRTTPYHSIIGDRGRNDSPNSSDGIVPYWSSHLDSAVSEKIIPSGHGANEHPEGIKEIQRILIENLKEK